MYIYIYIYIYISIYIYKSIYIYIYIGSLELGRLYRYKSENFDPDQYPPPQRLRSKINGGTERTPMTISSKMK